MKWVKASERLPGIEVVTLKELIDFGLNNGANIVGGMPWSFTFKGHPVTHENDSTYLVGNPSIICTEKHPVVFINDKVFPYWKDNPSKAAMATMHIKDERLADGLICMEGHWCLWDKRSRGSIRLDKLTSSLSLVKFSDIEWLDESPESHAPAGDKTAEEKLSYEVLLPIVERIAYEQLSGDQLGDLVKKMDLLANFIKDFCAPLSARIAELEAKVNELTMDNMTHEYNQAEAEKYAWEYEKQIRDEVVEAVREELKTTNLLIGKSEKFTDQDYAYIGVVVEAVKKLNEKK